MIRNLAPRIAVLFAFIFAALVLPRASNAYILPAHQMPQSDMALPAEDALGKYRAEMGQIASVASLDKLQKYTQNKKIRLSETERKELPRYLELDEELTFWQYVVDMKKSFLTLLPENSPADAVAEADLMAKMIVQKLYDISQEYQIKFTALFRNMQINRGTSKKGFCYHYVMDLISEISQKEWRYLDFRWGEAYAGTFRENNSLVITAAGAPFESGIAIDAWRAGGRPFWRAVSKDRFPWKEAQCKAYE